MSIEYIKVNTQVLALRLLSYPEAMLICLVASLQNGLSMSNDGIGHFLGMPANSVSRLIGRLKKKGLVEIVNPQSRHRRIYIGDLDKVDENYFDVLDTLLCHSGGATLAGMRTINKESKKKNKDFSGPASPAEPVGEELEDDWLARFGSHPATQKDIDDLIAKGIL